jgi:hypothetical protein
MDRDTAARIADLAETLTRPRFHTHCGETHAPGPCGDGVTRPVPYDRAVLEAILTYHWRHDIKGCGCGWSVLGASYPEHVAAVYEEAVTSKTVNRWGEPAGPDVPERGDHVQVRGGTTTGTVIAVERDEVWIVMDQPPGFLQSWRAGQLEVTRKLIP